MKMDMSNQFNPLLEECTVITKSTCSNDISKQTFHATC